MNKLTFNDFKKVKTKDYTWSVQIFYNLQSPHFPLRRKVGQLSNRKKGALLFYLYIISLCCQSTTMYSTTQYTVHNVLIYLSTVSMIDSVKIIRTLKQFSFFRRTSALWGSIPARRPPPCSRPRGRPTVTRTSRANAHPAPSPAATSEPAQPPAPRCSSCCAKRSRIGSS